jgi:HEAT repeat protein
MKLTVAAFLMAALAGPAWAQSQPSGSPADNPAAVLGRGWTALGAQQPARALELAERLLRTDPGNHEALALAVAAQTTALKPTTALDTYEKWLTAAGDEDVFVLKTIGMGVLRALTGSQQPRVRFAALVGLAQAGDTDARRQLDGAARDQSLTTDADAELAEAGDQAAIARLDAQLSSGGRGDKSSAIDALGKAKARGSSPAIIAALKDTAPPSRIAAANALAELEAVEAIPALRETLKDPDPAVRNMARVALARLGDPASAMTLKDLENSPIGEFRLLAATAAARQDPQGPWDEKVGPMLRDPDPMLRLEAARVLLEGGRQREAALATLGAGLSDDTPAVKTAAARTLRLLGQQSLPPDLPSLRRLLRDRLPDVQIEAARALVGRAVASIR